MTYTIPMDNSKNSKKTFVRGALILTASGLAVKILGAVYRIPLTNMLGAYGIGVYQLVFPLYALLLTICVGIPDAVCRKIAGRTGEAKQVFYVALTLLTVIGFIFAAALYLGAEVLGRLQRNPDLASAYRIISPAVLIVTVLSAFKGYFQGQMKMKPIAFTQITEQIVKLSVGLIGAYLSLPDIMKGVRCAVMAITFSELSSLLIIATIYYFDKDRDKKPVLLNRTKAYAELKSILSIAVPFTMSAIIMPISNVLDSILIQNLLTAANPTVLYGLWSGPTLSLMGLPLVLTAGISVSAIPSITRSHAIGDVNGVREKTNTALKMVNLVTLPCAIGLIMLANPIVSLLYGSLSASEHAVISRLVQTGGLSIIFIPATQVMIAVLQGSGKLYYPAVILGTSVLVKAGLNALLLPLENFSVQGAPIAMVASFGISAALSNFAVSKKLGIRIDWQDCLVRPLFAVCVMTLFVSLTTVFFTEFIGSRVGTILAVCLSALIYGAAIWMLGLMPKEEIKQLVLKKRAK